MRVEHDRHATSHLTSGELILETLCDWRAAERLLFDRPLTPAEFETVRLACVDLRLAYGRLAEMTSDEGSNEYRRLVDGARRAIEVGTYTGYSSLAVASALPPGAEPAVVTRIAAGALV